MSDHAPLVLASASPRRAHILRALGLAFDVVVSDVDETLLPGEGGAAAAERLARAKAERVAAGEARPVVAADTVVLCDGDVLGKPASPDDARAMLRRLSGRRHEVATGVCVAARGRLWSGLERTGVVFAPLGEAEIDWYAATGEPLDKAGAYHVDGQGALFIERVEGSPSNVAGLPVRLLLTLAREAGLDLGPPRG
jgi:septum formation protein